MFRPKYEPKLDDLILSALEEAGSPGKSEEEKTAAIERASKLDKLKSYKGLEPPSMNSVLLVGANIFGILWLARYEKENVIRSPSAFKFILRP